MNPATIDIIRAALTADPSVTPDDKKNMIFALRNHGKKPQEKELPVSQPPRVLSRADVAERLGLSLRAVDKLASEGVLRRIIYPGRKRGRGFSEKEVNQLITDRETYH